MIEFKYLKKRGRKFTGEKEKRSKRANRKVCTNWGDKRYTRPNIINLGGRNHVK